MKKIRNYILCLIPNLLILVDMYQLDTIFDFYISFLFTLW